MSSRAKAHWKNIQAHKQQTQTQTMIYPNNTTSRAKGSLAQCAVRMLHCCTCNLNRPSAHHDGVPLQLKPSGQEALSALPVLRQVHTSRSGHRHARPSAAAAGTAAGGERLNRCCGAAAHRATKGGKHIRCVLGASLGMLPPLLFQPRGCRRNPIPSIGFFAHRANGKRPLAAAATDSAFADNGLTACCPHATLREYELGRKAHQTHTSM
jgi:hypothetical protein